MKTILYAIIGIFLVVFATMFVFVKFTPATEGNAVIVIGTISSTGQVTRSVGDYNTVRNVYGGAMKKIHNNPAAMGNVEERFNRGWQEYMLERRDQWTCGIAPSIARVSKDPCMPEPSGTYCCVPFG